MLNAEEPGPLTLLYLSRKIPQTVGLSQLLDDLENALFLVTVSSERAHQSPLRKSRDTVLRFRLITRFRCILGRGGYKFSFVGMNHITLDYNMPSSVVFSGECESFKRSV